MPMRRMEKPALVVLLKSTSRSARRSSEERLTIPFARWKASENPKPSIVW